MISKNDQDDEMSMEEILASIRRFVSDNPPVGDEPQIKQHSSDVLTLANPLVEPSTVPSPVEPSTVTPVEPKPPMASEDTVKTAAESMSKLNEIAKSTTPRDNSLDFFVREIARTLVREWIDNNLPKLVEEMVQREIKRITRHIA